MEIYNIIHKIIYNLNRMYSRVRVCAREENNKETI